MSDDEKQWWQTLPAIIGGIAALLTALTGLLIALNQLGVFKQATPAKSAEGVQESKKPPLTLVASIWKVELGQKSTMLATKEFSSGAGPGVSPTSLEEFAEWVSNQLHLGGGEPVPVRIGVEKFAGPDKITERVCSELKANHLIQIVDPVMLETVRRQMEEQRENMRLHPMAQTGVRSLGIRYIISGRAQRKTP